MQISDSQFRALADNIPTPCWMAGPDGFIFWYNRQWYVYTGTSAAEMEGWGWQSVHDPDELPKVLERWQGSIATGQTFEMVFPLKRADGEYHPFLTRVSPHRDGSGAITGWFGVNTDITEQVKAQKALQESEAKFRTFAQAMPNQVWSATPDGELDWFNDQVFAYSGLTSDYLAGNGWVQMVHADDIGDAAAEWTRCLASGALYETEFRLRSANGDFRWHLARAVPIKDSSGAISRWIGTNTDIQEQKAIEARQKMLTDELEHRIKNTMAMVGAIAHQTFRKAVTKDEAQSVLEARLHALNQAHEVLTQSSWSSASMPAVVESALAPHRTGDDSIQARGPAVELSPKQALSLALALHELATNATKYGALSVPGGTIEVSWDCHTSGSGQILRFQWRESGGPVVTPPSRRGFGSRLIESTLSSEFGDSTKLEFRPEGLVCSFETIITDASASQSYFGH